MNAQFTRQERKLCHVSIVAGSYVRYQGFMCPILGSGRLFPEGEHHSPFVAVVEDVGDPRAGLEPELVDRDIRGCFACAASTHSKGQPRLSGAFLQSNRGDRI